MVMISHALQSVQSTRSPTDVLAVNCFYMAVCVMNSCVYIYSIPNLNIVCPSCFLHKLKTQCCQEEVIKLLLIAALVWVRLGFKVGIRLLSDRSDCHNGFCTNSVNTLTTLMVVSFQRGHIPYNFYSLEILPSLMHDIRRAGI